MRFSGRIRKKLPAESKDYLQNRVPANPKRQQGLGFPRLRFGLQRKVFVRRSEKTR
jgi:hypothetical protein